jgi:N-acetylneuraminate lyase
MNRHLTGLIAAVYTPMHADGSLNLAMVPAVVDHLAAGGVSGLFVCGSTGEGVSLTGEERRAVAEAYIRAARGRLPAIVQVGHNSLAEARQLAEHARQAGARAVSAIPPSYFKITSVAVLVDCMAEIAGAAADIPFYYYHIPSLTGVTLGMAEFLEQASPRLANLAGVKFTAPALDEFQACLELAQGRFDVLWGLDEMLLAALAVGARGAVGSTYNIAAPLYRRLIGALEAGRLEDARRCQSMAVELIRILNRRPFHSAVKAVLKMLGMDCGPCRLPIAPVRPEDAGALRRELDGIGFFEWSRPESAERR